MQPADLTLKFNGELRYLKLTLPNVILELCEAAIK